MAAAQLVVAVAAEDVVAAAKLAVAAEVAVPAAQLAVAVVVVVVVVVGHSIVAALPYQWPVAT